MNNSFLSKKRNVIIFAFLAIFVESFSSVFLKIGGKFPLFSFDFIFYFALAVFVLGTYSILWQIILEHMPLSTAYLRKGISYILVFVWAAVFFKETVTWAQIIGGIIIIIGMVVSNSDNN